MADFLELDEANLYVPGVIATFADGDMLLRREYAYVPHPLDRPHTVRTGELIDFIANKHYKEFVADAWRWWWIICDANGIIDPTDLTPYVGQEIVIPYLPVAKLQRYAG